MVQYFYHFIICLKMFGNFKFDLLFMKVRFYKGISKLDLFPSNLNIYNIYVK